VTIFEEVTMAGDHRATANHNIEILHLAGFKKQGNTSIFKKKGCTLLSPAVSCGQAGHYWFDVRKVNVDKIKGENSYILIRIVPDMFVMIEISDFSSLLLKRTQRFRKNSGEVWGFYIELNISTNMAQIVSSSDSSSFYSTPILEKDQTFELLKIH